MKLTNEQRKGQEVLFKIIEEAWNNEAFKESSSPILKNIRSILWQKSS